jgi:hypothetical protein
MSGVVGSNGSLSCWELRQWVIPSWDDLFWRASSPIWALRHDVEFGYTVRVLDIIGRIVENTWVAIGRSDTLGTD